MPTQNNRNTTIYRRLDPSASFAFSLVFYKTIKV